MPFHSRLRITRQMTPGDMEHFALTCWTVGSVHHVPAEWASEFVNLGLAIFEIGVGDDPEGPSTEYVRRWTLGKSPLIIA